MAVNPTTCRSFLLLAVLANHIGPLLPNMLVAGRARSNEARHSQGSLLRGWMDIDRKTTGAQSRNCLPGTSVLKDRKMSRTSGSAHIGTNWVACTMSLKGGSSDDDDDDEGHLQKIPIRHSLCQNCGSVPCRCPRPLGPEIPAPTWMFRKENATQEEREREQRCLQEKMPGALFGVKPRREFQVIIDKSSRRVLALDHRGVELSPTTGFPRKLPRLQIMEIEVPPFVHPGDNFTYVVAGCGHIKCTAPQNIPEAKPGFFADRGPTMLIAVPERMMGTVPHRYTDGAFNPWFNGTYTSAERLPPEVCYFDVRTRYVTDLDKINGTDGEWEVPPVNDTLYWNEYAAAMRDNADAAWNFFLADDGSVQREQAKGKRARRRANPWGVRKAETMFRVLDVFGPALKADVHYPSEEGSVQRNYTLLVDGDCPTCTTDPPSPLAMRWLPRVMRRQYVMLLNVSAAAAAGDAAAQAALPYFNTSALKERMSIYQIPKYNNGRLRVRYAYRDFNVTCKECGTTWERTPFTLSPHLNETLVPTTFEWTKRQHLFTAAEEGDAQAIVQLASHIGCNVNATDENNDWCTALHMAAYGDHVDAVNVLLQMNSSVDKTDARNWTALHWACQGGGLNAAAALLDAGADVNFVGGVVGRGDRFAGGFTALHWAAYLGHCSLVRMLIERGARMQARDMRGHTPLHVACLWAQSAACEVLVELGADCQDQDDKGYTAPELAHECYLKYHFESMRPHRWWGTPLETFPGPSAWMECEERVKRAERDKAAYDRRRLEQLAGGGSHMDGGKRMLEGGVQGGAVKRVREGASVYDNS